MKKTLCKQIFVNRKLGARRRDYNRKPGARRRDYVKFINGLVLR